MGLCPPCFGLNKQQFLLMKRHAADLDAVGFHKAHFLALCLLYNVRSQRERERERERERVLELQTCVPHKQGLNPRQVRCLTYFIVWVLCSKLSDSCRFLSGVLGLCQLH